jgi:hypothetical protein
MRQTISIDFDGVIHSYTSGWNRGAITDPPVPGAAEALTEILKEFDIVVFTARDDLHDVAAYMHKQFGLTCFVDHLGTLRGNAKVVIVTNRKPASASMFIDDRGYHFTRWSSALAEIRHRFK